jgi:hypothetical protein
MEELDELLQQKRQIENDYSELVANRKILQRRLKSKNLMDRAMIQQQFNNINTQLATLSSEYDQIVNRITEMSYETDEERPRTKAKTDISPEQREGGSIGLPQMEQMNLFGVGDIFR